MALALHSKDGRIFKVGDMVMLREKQPPKDHCGLLMVNYGRVKRFMSQEDYPDGIELDRHLGGCRYWNASDLIVFQAPPPRETSDEDESLAGAGSLK